MEVEKIDNSRKPQHILRMTDTGREAFRAYKTSLQEVPDDLPD